MGLATVGASIRYRLATSVSDSPVAQSWAGSWMVWSTQAAVRCGEDMVSVEMGGDGGSVDSVVDGELVDGRAYPVGLDQVGDVAWGRGVVGWGLITVPEGPLNEQV